jgi:hypothetical protein
MTFRWVLRDSSHRQLSTTDAFETQAAAEEWLKDNWERLLDNGARSVVLKRDEEILYEMGLEPA